MGRVSRSLSLRLKQAFFAVLVLCLSGGSEVDAAVLPAAEAYNVTFSPVAGYPLVFRDLEGNVLGQADENSPLRVQVGSEAMKAANGPNGIDVAKIIAGLPSRKTPNGQDYAAMRIPQTVQLTNGHVVEAGSPVLLDLSPFAKAAPRVGAPPQTPAARRLSPASRTQTPSSQADTETTASNPDHCVRCHLPQTSMPTSTADQATRYRDIVQTAAPRVGNKPTSVEEAREIVRRYSNSRKVQRLVSLRPPKYSLGACYHYVKQHLYDSGLLAYNVLNGLIPAQGAVRDLGNENWVNVMKEPFYNQLFGDIAKDPRRAPLGSVLVYKGDCSQRAYCYGDVTVRTRDGFVNDEYKPNAMTKAGRIGRHFTLIGVMIDPNVQ